MWEIPFNCMLVKNLLTFVIIVWWGKVWVEKNRSEWMLSDYVRALAFFFLFQFSSMMCQFSVVESKSATFPTEKPRHLLDDSVLESHSPVRNHTLNSVFTNGISIGKNSMACWIFCLSVSAALKYAVEPITTEAERLFSFWTKKDWSFLWEKVDWNHLSTTHSSFMQLSSAHPHRSILPH